MNQPEAFTLIPGAAYIRYSSEMQSESFSLDAKLRQIHEQAKRDGVEIVKVYADPAQSAYREKYRPGINAMREGARRGEWITSITVEMVLSILTLLCHPTIVMHRVWAYFQR